MASLELRCLNLAEKAQDAGARKSDALFRRALAVAREGESEASLVANVFGWWTEDLFRRGDFAGAVVKLWEHVAACEAWNAAHPERPADDMGPGFETGALILQRAGQSARLSEFSRRMAVLEHVYNTVNKCA